MFCLLFLSVSVGFVAAVYKLMGLAGVAGCSLLCGFAAYLMRLFR